MRRGFTMLEVVMAASLGALVVIACLSVMYTMQRTDEMLAKRAEHAGDLERLRMVAQRATTTLVMSTDRLPPAPRSGEQDVGAGSRFGRFQAGEAGGLAPVPRLILEDDQRAGGWVMRSTGGRDFQADASPVQRIEFVLSDPPVPSAESDFFARAGLREGERLSRRDSQSRFANESRFSKESRFAGSAPENVRSKNEGVKTAAEDPSIKKADTFGESGEEDLGSVRAVRGALEVRPQRPSGRTIREAAANDEEVPEAYEVWWVPLPPRENGSDRPSEEAIGLAGDPVKVAGNLRFVKWRLFDDREWKSALEATWFQQLPAYMELSAETTSGMTAKWLFEVDWATGPEVPPRPGEGIRRAEAVDDGGQNARPATPPPAGGTPTGRAPPPSSRPTRPAMPKATPIPPPPSKSGGGR